MYDLARASMYFPSNTKVISIADVIRLSEYDSLLPVDNIGHMANINNHRLGQIVITAVTRDSSSQ